MKFDPKLSVTEGLDHLAERLDPIITAKFPTDLGGHPWTVVLEELDHIGGKTPKTYSTTDLQAQLKVLTRRLGSLGFPFDDYKQTLGALGRELTIVRNARAHGDPFTTLDAWRAHDFCVRLLEYFSDAEGLLKANELRQEALAAHVDEEGLAPTPVAPETIQAPSDEDLAVPREDREQEPDVVTPDPDVYTRETGAKGSGVIGNERMPFESWKPVPVGDVSVLDDLPRVAAKQKVRSVAVEVVDAEGPIHLDRLSSLVAASFGVRKLHANRAAKIARQAKAAGLVVDKAKFVWPQGVDPESWSEFRPNTSQIDRPFVHISPVEVANAMRFLRERFPDFSEDDLETETLRTFGRKRRTKQVAAHLAKAKSLL